MFPHSEPICVGEHELTAREVLDFIEPFMTEHRRETIARVAAMRTYSIATVLDGLYDRGNISAVMRSAEALGYQDLHLIETQATFKAANRVTQGTDKWLDIHLWEDPADCAAKLKADGYQLVVTHLEAAVPIEEIDFTRPTAIVFGNERDGASQAMIDAADATVIIPMNGFAQSFNISVAAAISLYHIKRERERLGRHADLDEHEIEILHALYVLRSAQNPVKLIERGINQRNAASR